MFAFDIFTLIPDSNPKKLEEIPPEKISEPEIHPGKIWAPKISLKKIL